MNNKKWVFSFILANFLLLSTVLSFNLYIDSLGLVSKNSYLDNAAKDLSRGKIIAGLKNFDERIFRKKTIENLNIDLEWIAVGSSRTMQLRQRMFSDINAKFHNYSVSGASIEDYLGLIQVHKNKFKTLPKNIILGVDPWIFNENSGQKRYMSLNKEYEQFLEILNYPKKESKVNKRVLKLFSMEYFLKNIKFVKKNLSNGLKGYYIVEDINSDMLTREPDGAIQYPLKKRFPNSQEVKKAAISYTQGKVYSLEKFTKLSNQELFKKFLIYLKKNGVNIYIYLPPYNPYSYDLLIKKEQYKIILKVEKYVHSIGKELNIPIIGSYNAHLLNLKNEDFFDAMHSLDNVYEELFKNII